MRVEKMRRHWVSKGLKFALFAAVAVTVLGALVMSLWNWLMPPLFGWQAIGFWQALGLLALSRILLGGFHGGPGRHHWRQRMIERWEQMTPEEREKLRAGLRARCGHSTDSAGESPA
jgi:hypothetical protein